MVYYGVPTVLVYFCYAFAMVPLSFAMVRLWFYWDFATVLLLFRYGFAIAAYGFAIVLL